MDEVHSIWLNKELADRDKSIADWDYVAFTFFQQNTYVLGITLSLELGDNHGKTMRLLATERSEHVCLTPHLITTTSPRSTQFIFIKRVRFLPVKGRKATERRKDRKASAAAKGSKKEKIKERPLLAELQVMAPEFLVPLVDVTCLLGDTVILQCKVCGRPKPTITWKGPDQNILDTDNSSATYTVSSCKSLSQKIQTSDEVSSISSLESKEHPFGVPSDSGEITLKICNLMPQDSGIYTCIATNDHGTTSTSATVKVQGVPAAPNRPIAQERSCTSVILRWLPPSSTGNCTISGYTVEYREEGSQIWQQSVASTLDTYLVIEDLSPGCPYQFRVSASNPWGISLPSEPSDFVRLPEYGESKPSPGPPGNAAADGATISWKENFDSAYTELNEIGRQPVSIPKV
ncbi:hypothetical protein P7K49_031005 [Saguinus oedipus]|uniref:Uncharacterized protein n=1 Tax=Saguinus oedipus TaxID=9490 RepID=A0ABQ9U3W7_SAGOE|nr:hypothetical protein P7K49_031005 [Saguinus oedipus]